MKLSIDIENTSLHGLRQACLVECDMFAKGWGKKPKKGGLGWAFFLASLSSLEVECLSPPPPLFELLALGQVTKKDSITGRWNPKWPCLPPYVCSCVCVCEVLTRTCHISYTLSSLFSVCLPVCCTPPNTPFPCAQSQQPLGTHTLNPQMYGLCF